MNRVETIRKAVDQLLINKGSTDNMRTGWVHLYGVSQFCTLLAIKRNLDFEIASVCGMLHDIYTYNYQYEKNHAELGLQDVEKILRSTNLFTDEEITIILTAIRNHSLKKVIHDPYSELLKDADTLQNSLYNPGLKIKHKKRLKLLFLELNITAKLKQIKGINLQNERSDIKDNFEK